MQQQPIDRQLLHTWVTGNCTPEQLAQVQEYLTQPQYRQSLEAFLAEDWQQTTAAPTPVTHKAIQQYQQFRHNTAAATSHPLLPLPSATPVRHIMARIAGIAAMLVITAGSAWYLWQMQQPDTAVSQLQWKELYSQAGKVTSVLLPDSSMVYLGPASSLRYNNQYNNSNRQVYLKGEAYFIAHHQPGPSLAVTTGRLTTVDVGTEFNIRHYAEDAAIEVTVAKGEVAVMQHSADTAGIKLASLTAGGRLRYDTASTGFTQDLVNQAALIGSWRNGILHFRNQPLQQVALALSRFYNVQIRFKKPERAAERITTTIRRLSLPEALNVLTLTAGISYKKEGEIVWIQ